MKKAIHYAYPTSTIANNLKFKNGVFYVTRTEKYTDLNPHIVCGAEKLSDCQAMAETMPEEYHIFCGVIQNGKNFK